MTKISNATLVAAATDGMKMPTGEIGDLAVSVGQIKTNILTAAAALFDPAGAGPYWKVTGTTTITGPVLITGVDANQVSIQNVNTGSYETSMTVGSGAAELLMGTNANHYAKFRVTGSLATTAISQMYVEDDNSDYITLTMSSAHTLILDSSFTDFGGIEWTGWDANDFSNDTLVPKGWAQQALVSGTNIKTVNGNSLLGSGNLAISGGSRTILYKNHIAASAGSTTSETIVDSFLVAGGTMGANDALDIDLMFSKTNQNATWSMAVYVNTSASLVGATLIAQFSAGATIRFNRLFRTMWFRNSVSSQSVFNTAATASNDDYSTSATGPTALSIDFSTDKYFIIAIDPNSASDTCYIETSLFEIIRS